MEHDRTYDLLILGGGPGGYAAAIRAKQLGLTVALIEKESVGGVCLHHGCIPSKSLLRAAEVLALVRRAGEFGIRIGQIQADFGEAVDRSQKIVQKLHRALRHLMTKNGVDIYKGDGQLVMPDPIAVATRRKSELIGTRSATPCAALAVTTPHEETLHFFGRRILIATGSRVRGLPEAIPAPALDGVQFYTSDEALLRRDLPKSVVIIGGGAVGCEFAWLYSVYGVQVSLIECAPCLLPSEDREVSAALERSFKRRGIAVFTSVRIDAIRQGEGRMWIESTGESLSAEAVLLAVGRNPNVEGIGCDAVGITLRGGAIEVDEGMRTSVANIFAVGDVTTRPALAHGAMAQGVAVAESIAGVQRPPVNFGAIPSAIYCQPQVASVGLTEAAARAAGHAIRVGGTSFSANGKACAIGETEGFVKIIADTASDQILGAHIVGSEATELIGEFVLAMSTGISAAALMRAVHPHPTLSEAAMEAAGAVWGQAIHGY